MEPKQLFHFNRSLLRSKKFLMGVGAAVAVVVLLLAIWLPAQQLPELLSMSDVASGITHGQITSIEDSLATGEMTLHYTGGRIAKALRDTSAPLVQQLSYLGISPQELTGVQIKIEATDTAMTVSRGIGTVLSVAVIAFLAFMAVRTLRTSGPARQKKFEEGIIPDVHFYQVAGMDENLQELKDVVTFLKEGDKYTAMGAKMPRGVLLVGDPGCGKTLIAKAVAGEAGVPFFALSGSEFVEVFAGVGASRVRALFEKARKKAPSIIFIDEIDAVGRERHNGSSGAEMEQDQTLNQLLVEMDGFSSTENVIVLAATNRMDILDPALTRAGRFDRRVFVTRPDIKGREEILKIHMQGKRISPDVSLSNVARATPGLVGADLANIVNEAAIIAVRADHSMVEMGDFEEAVEKNLTGGVQRKNSLMSAEERRIVAYHEAGHAITMHATRLSDPVYKITIIPRGAAGGYTMSLPVEDTMLHSKNKILARITGLMGGRAAEEIFFHDVTSGAANDLQVATQLAEEMVMRLGMDSATGLRVYPQQQGYAALAAPHNSQKTSESIDEAVKNILDSCYSQARQILSEQCAYVERVANELLEVETLSRDEFVRLMNAPILNHEAKLKVFNTVEIG